MIVVLRRPACQKVNLRKMVKRFDLRLWLVPVLLLVPLWIVKIQRGKSTAYILSRYAQMHWGAIRDDHIQVQELQRYHNPIVLRTTWFPPKSSRGICAPASEVRADGSVEAWVDACGNSHQDYTRAGQSILEMKAESVRLLTCLKIKQCQKENPNSIYGITALLARVAAEHFSRWRIELRNRFIG